MDLARDAMPRLPTGRCGPVRANVSFVWYDHTKGTLSATSLLNWQSMHLVGVLTLSSESTNRFQSLELSRPDETEIEIFEFCDLRYLVSILEVPFVCQTHPKSTYRGRCNYT